MIDHGPRTASAECATDCFLSVIDHRQFGAALDDLPSLSPNVMKRMAALIRELDRTAYG